KDFDKILSAPRSLGDRLYLRGIAAGLGPASKEEVVSTVESYRVYLLDDAASRQEPLETLGDTMLKLAFLGTVYGISVALFSARGLDTADPITKLAAKAAMYSGIGVGFGTTLVGIFLSIVAAQMRSNLSTAWAGEIGAAYRLILDFGAEKLIDEGSRWPRPPNFPPPTRRGGRGGWTGIHVFGVFVMFSILVVLVAMYHVKMLKMVW